VVAMFVAGFGWVVFLWGLCLLRELRRVGHVSLLLQVLPNTWWVMSILRLKSKGSMDYFLAFAMLVMVNVKFMIRLFVQLIISRVSNGILARNVSIT